jgi:hypothetical protein
VTARIYAPLAAVLLSVLAAGMTGAADSAATAADKASDVLAHDIYKQLIEINTTDSVGNVTTAAEAMAKRFLDAGFPPADVFVGGPTDRKKNVVVRLHGTGRHRPVLLIARTGGGELPHPAGALAGRDPPAAHRPAR